MEIIEKIKRIKYLRLKSEGRFLFDILNKVDKGFSDDYPQSIFFSLNGKLLFEQDDKNDRFWVSHDDIWFVLINKYGLNYNDCQEIIKNMVWNTLKLKVNPPIGVYKQ